MEVLLLEEVLWDQSLLLQDLVGRHLLDVLVLVGGQASGVLAFLVLGDLHVVLAWEVDLQAFLCHQGEVGNVD